MPVRKSNQEQLDADIDGTVVLIGRESSGKSALFRSLTGEATGDETNVRGSTVRVRTGRIRDEPGVLVDTPGIRLKDDSLTTHIALGSMRHAARVALIVRGTNFKQDIEDLVIGLRQKLAGHRVALIVTFGDLAPGELRSGVSDSAKMLGVPTAVVNARRMSPSDRRATLDAIRCATQLHTESPRLALLRDVPVVEPGATLFEHPTFGPWLSLAAIFGLFAMPVWLAFLLASSLQPALEIAIRGRLTPHVDPLARSAPLVHALLTGDYGLLTLGAYSFLWAFPVVLFIGISLAITEEMGLKDRITAALDPWMRRIGLSGRDLIPVLSGFGCNVVAVFHTRACSVCTRRACVSLIAFGSACSYQMGAALSLFNSAGHPWLFLPYLLFLFFVGAAHTRVWNPALRAGAASACTDRAFFQNPTLRGALWRVRAVVKQFLMTAMPVFVCICLIAAVLHQFGVLDAIARASTPAFDVLGLPPGVAPAVVFSVIRKDGLLVLNQGQGALLQHLSAAQVFIVVYLGSTLTACLVTLLTIAKELTGRFALRLIGQQAVTAVLSTLALVILSRVLEASR